MSTLSETSPDLVKAVLIHLVSVDDASINELVTATGVRHSDIRHALQPCVNRGLIIHQRIAGRTRDMYRDPNGSFSLTDSGRALAASLG